MARKSRAAPQQVPQTRQEFEETAVKLAEGMRKLASASAKAADAIARIKLSLKADTSALEAELDRLWDAVAAYATAHRTELLPADRKSVAIAAGVIGWRTGMPSVKFTAEEEEIIDAIQAHGFDQLLREKVEIDKAALIADPEAAAKIEGVLIRQVESLFFTPLDLDVERTKALKVGSGTCAEAA